ncbi:hypothetical protein BAUCODRAFT_146032 [Baudoinia panamericana UAMH 10762]|uniref:Uncharacterized protein n=1 Tax=Baudoinia panamericana (strain UAMH 10762) TaxID=717646 RepID=M2LWL7_BAUPA|nr:uncharacterized protein BAUCODRAFT_146032 [Baudoinia panamericana UAMH 10762]EMC99047.1 hypothetical protein BAUCODRAFT_146032 [Baudoinia panamericana UAMH 10762]
MAMYIPPLDFSHSQNSFVTTRNEQASVPSDGDSAVSDDTNLSGSVRDASTVAESMTAGNSTSTHTSTASTSSHTEPEYSISKDRSLHRVGSGDHQRNKLVRRAESSASQDSSRVVSAKGTASYRCDIHATSGSNHKRIEIACKKLVIAAGGSLIEHFAYLGGFLYSLPTQTLNPLRDGMELTAGVVINVAPCTPFPKWPSKQRRPEPYRVNASSLPSQLTAGLIMDPETLRARCCGNRSTKSKTVLFLSGLLKSHERVSYVA